MVLMGRHNLKSSNLKETENNDFILVKVNKEKDKADVDVKVSGKALVVLAAVSILPSAICMIGINRLAGKIFRKNKKRAKLKQWRKDEKIF